MTLYCHNCDNTVTEKSFAVEKLFIPTVTDHMAHDYSKLCLIHRNLENFTISETLYFQRFQKLMTHDYCGMPIQEVVGPIRTSRRIIKEIEYEC